jgi:hypothetical protein
MNWSLYAETTAVSMASNYYCFHPRPSASMPLGSY